MPSNKKILITEDEGIVALEIRETLENLGYYVVGEAQTGQEAIELARDNKPDLVLMDITLQGDMDGIEAAERIYNLYDIPIIFLTSHSDEATIKRAMRSNPFGYLIKPFNDRELYSNIEMTLHKHSV
ncbi:MAG: response regulator, partial [Methanomicrobium sp.]|nr:response regulator [Methanomicrobium sp.]